MSKISLSIALFLVLSFVLSCAASTETPFWLRGHNVFWPNSNEPMNTPRANAEQMQNALRSTQRLRDLKFNGQNPFEKSGHILVNKEYESHMYYLLFDAQEQPTHGETPLILWLQGGPGCASTSTGNFAEIGPFHISDNLELVENKYAWNKQAHLLFIDNPVGAGYSYTKDSRGYVTNEREMADNLYKTLLGVYSRYPHLQNAPLTIAGESYAGSYIPSIAYKIQQEGYKVNLKNIAVGDGLTHPVIQFAAYDEFAIANALISENDLPLVQELQNKTSTAIRAKDWKVAMQYTDKLMGTIVELGGGVNVYDIREYGNYNFDNIDKYLALPAIKKMMNAVGLDFHDCDGQAYQALYEDMPQSVLPQLESILREGRVNVLYYNGVDDLIITNIGSSTFLRQADWKYQQDFKDAKRRTWKVKDEQGKARSAGWVRSAATLTYVQVHNAGHMVPMNQGLNSQSMIYSFINGQL